MTNPTDASTLARRWATHTAYREFTGISPETAALYQEMAAALEELASTPAPAEAAAEDKQYVEAVKRAADLAGQLHVLKLQMAGLLSKWQLNAQQATRIGFGKMLANGFEICADELSAALAQAQDPESPFDVTGAP